MSEISKQLDILNETKVEIKNAIIQNQRKEKEKMKTGGNNYE